MKFINIVTLYLLILLQGCGGDSSSFDENAQNPVIEESSSETDSGRIISNGKIYVNENVLVAYKIEATDRSELKYYITGTDASLLSVNINTGKVVFNELPDFETKSVYNFTVAVEDIAGHRTSKEVTIYIRNIKEEDQSIIIQRDFDSPLTGIEESKYFITTWKTDNRGESNDNQITILTQSRFGYNYRVDWGDGTSSIGVTEDITHTYPTSGTYTVKIFGDFPSFSTVKDFPSFSFFKDFTIEDIVTTDALKLLSIEQWGDIKWYSMHSAFIGCSNLSINATDKPNLSNVTRMGYMFYYMKNFNQDIGDWDVSNVEDMSYMFAGASSFNQNISSWDVSNVDDMSMMFFKATNFNRDIGEWNVSNVAYMKFMFHSATNFNQDISNWNVSNVTNMKAMFAYANKFNQNISNWDVSNVTNMEAMLTDATKFNQDISGWDVSSVSNMLWMFGNAHSFTHQDLSSWNVSNVTNHENFGYGWGSGNTEPNWNQ